MPIITEWIVPNKICLSTASDPVTGALLKTETAAFLALLDTTTSSVPLIADWRQVTGYPDLAEFMPIALKLLRHPHFGWMIMVPNNFTLNLWASVFRRVLHFKLQRFNTVDEVVTFLQRLDAQSVPV